jgi:hypothetical protein
MTRAKPKHQLIAAEVEPPPKTFACGACWNQRPEAELIVVKVTRNGIKRSEFRCRECDAKGE